MPQGAFFEISHGGAEGRIIREIEVVKLDTVADRFDPTDQMFLHVERSDDRDDAVRGTQVDLATENVACCYPRRPVRALDRT